MSRSSNTLKTSDVTTVPIQAKYSATYLSSSAYDSGITLNRGVNTSFDSSSIQFLNYALARQLYYQEYITGSLLNAANYWDPSLQSTAAEGTFDNDYRYFPTESGAQITVLAMPRSVFGEGIGRKSLTISGSTYTLIDDGNGNILDSLNSGVHVGNVLYSQGIIIITNLDYEYALIDTLIPTTTTTSTTTTTTTGTPTTSTTTTTTTDVPTTTTTTTSTTSTTTTEPPTTTTTSTTSTTSTTTTTTTEPPTTTTTTTTTSTTSTTTTEPPETVTIDACANVQANGSGNVVAYAYSSVPVDTNVTVDLTWTASDTSTISGTVTILAGETCGTVTLTGADPNETGAGLEITAIAPGSFGNQTYVEGVETLSASCTTCPV